MKTFNLQLDAQDMQVLNSALVNLPYHLAAPVINKINAQLAYADNATTQNVTEDAPAKKETCTTTPYT